MSLYVFNNQQKVIKVIQYKRIVEATQEIELNGTDELTVEMPNKDWDKLEEEPLYLAVRDTVERFLFHMYKILREDVSDDTVTVKGVQIGYDEMKAYGYIQDRRFTQASMQSVANAIVDGTDWQTGFVDSNLPAISTNFYYISRLEAIRKVIEANGCEIRFRVEITGNRIVSKRIDFLKRMSSDKGKRFSYGSKLLSVVKEKDSAELYTALVGRGKGEEVGDGYGRRIGFEDIEWSVANGDPVDKPLGQEFVELPDMTALYGYPDGEPRTGIVEFNDTEDEGLLLSQTYEQLIEVSRPQVQFKATVQLIGDAELGETVSIIRHDLNFKYKTRIFKMKRDLLNNNRTEIELGDRITESLGRTIRRIDTTNQRREERIVEYVQNTADGKNKIFRQAATPDTGMTVNDLWYKPVGEGETELYRWNGNIWELEKISAGLIGGTLDAENGDVNLINVNVSSIVGEIGEFIKLGLTSANSNLNLNGDGLAITSIDGENVTALENGRLAFYHQNGYLGYMGSSVITGDRAEIGGMSINVEHGEGFLIAKRERESDGFFKEIVQIMPDSVDLRLNAQLHMNQNIEMRGFNINGVNRVQLQNATSRIERYGTDGMRLFMPDGDFQVSQGSDEAFRVESDTFYMNRTLHMRGNDITNQSDKRLKKNIKETNLNALDVIDQLTFVDYEWTDEDMPDGTHTGLIAQDSPYISGESSDGYMHINSSKQIMVNTQAVQELHKKTKEQQQEINELKRLVNALVEKE